MKIALIAKNLQLCEKSLMQSRLLVLAFFFIRTALCAQPGFVQVHGDRFSINGQPYYYIGTNYWYGPLLLWNHDSVAGKKRLVQELDFLKKNGVNNLRVLAAAEGEGIIIGNERVGPAYQPKQGVFRDSLLRGLDLLLSEMGKRNMKAVLYLSNNWEWSGGFLQYLNWNGLMPDSVMQRPLSWDEYRDYVSRFYTCVPCTAAYKEQVKRIVGRTNSITGKNYRNDPTIMAWQLANEPRPMRPASTDAYVQWVEQTAALIKSIDKNHLVSTGSEGLIGSENAETFSRAHQLKNIDYLTIHIWPKNWQWFRDTAISKGFDSVIRKTMDYTTDNLVYAARLHKPLVIEEFGLPRDGQKYAPGSPTYWRNRYFENLMSRVVRSAKSGGILAGCNFWGFAGSGRANTNSHWWSEGDDYVADPPMEEQGLNSVFDVDRSAWAVITRYTGQLQRITTKRHR